ncbi:MAG TPA: hypothetical protein VFJ85_09875 [Acidimicrobiales bacterium]|nr:hypothetical protein [Acidimicrobiales bacterium]
MFKRLFWLVVGAGFGFGVSFWVMRTVRERLERMSPDRMSADMANAVRDFGRDVRAAISEGASAMRDKEAELRRQIESTPGG